MKTAAAAAAVWMLCACGGGGGGGGSTLREVPLSSFPVSNQIVVMTGVSQTASGNASVDPFGDVTLSGVALNVIDEANSTARMTFSPGSTLSGISFSTPQSSTSFRAGEIDCATSPVCSALNSAGTSLAVVIDPIAAGWNYQTFGTWLNETGPTTFSAGAMSAGAVTPGNAVPTVGIGVIFNGVAAGFFVDASGVPHSIASGMQALVNFEDRNMTFNTFATRRGNLNTGFIADDDSLNISGTLSYGMGESRFTGPVTNQGGNMSGTATGRFFGPAAQEMGGAYGLTGAGGQMLGAFGAKRQ